VRKSTVFFAVMLLSEVLLFGQKVQNSGRNVFWGDDFVVNNQDISGKFSAVQRSSGHIMAGIVDSFTIPTEGLRIVASVDLGVTWFGYSNIYEKRDYQDIKLVRTSDDSVYCFYRVGNDIICWNIDDGIRPTIINNAVSFDVIVTSTDNFYIFVENTTQGLYYYSSTDRGMSWGEIARLININGARPKVSEIGMGEYFAVTYYSDITNPLSYSKLVTTPCVEYIPGILASGSLMVVTPGGSDITEFDNARYADKIWVIYSERVGDNIDIYGKYHLDGGTFSEAIPIATEPNIQEYYIDVVANKDLGGFDMIYYRDSVDLTQLTNETDKLIYSYEGQGVFSFTPKYHISQHPPFWSQQEYAPKLVPLPYSQLNTNVGAMWMGYDNGVNKLFYDSYFAVTKIGENATEIPDGFKLFNNYPNPFNPETVIKYQLSSNSHISLKVYDVLGNEVAVLVDKTQSAGVYDIKFFGDQLSSGVYFYKLQAGDFVSTKKMVLMQ